MATDEMEEYRNHFKRARFARNRFFGWFMAWFPFVGVLGLAHRFLVRGLQIESPRVSQVIGAIEFATLILWTVKIIQWKYRLEKFVCPKCGSRYRWHPYTFKCSKCGLKESDIQPTK